MVGAHVTSLMEDIDGIQCLVRTILTPYAFAQSRHIEAGSSRFHTAASLVEDIDGIQGLVRACGTP